MTLWNKTVQQNFGAISSLLSSDFRNLPLYCTDSVPPWWLNMYSHFLPPELLILLVNPIFGARTRILWKNRVDSQAAWCDNLTLVWDHYQSYYWVYVFHNEIFHLPATSVLRNDGEWKQNQTNKTFGERQHPLDQRICSPLLDKPIYVKWANDMVLHKYKSRQFHGKSVQRFQRYVFWSMGKPKWMELASENNGGELQV